MFQQGWELVNKCYCNVRSTFIPRRVIWHMIAAHHVDGQMYGSLFRRGEDCEYEVSLGGDLLSETCFVSMRK